MSANSHIRGLGNVKLVTSYRTGGIAWAGPANREGKSQDEYSAKTN